MSPQDRPLLWNADQVITWLRKEFPQAFMHGGNFAIERLEPGQARVRAVLDDTALRPGGTVMGPAMMKVADISCYVLLLGHDGEKAALSVTTNMSMSFLRKPEPGDIVCEIKTLKHGRTLVVMDLKLYSVASDALIANAEMTYYNAAR